MNAAGYAGHGSAARLSRALGVTPKAVAKWLQGDAKPTLERAADLANALQVDPEWLLWGQVAGHESKETLNGIPVTIRTKETIIRRPHGDLITLGELANERAKSPKEQVDHPDLIPISPWDDNTPVEDDEVEVPFLREVELSAGSGRLVVQESTRAKLRFGKMTLRRHSVQFDQAVCVPVHGNSMEPVLPDGSTVAINKAATHVIDGKMYALSHSGQLRVKSLYRLPGGGIRMRSFNREEHPDEEYSPEQMKSQEIVILGKVFWSAAFH
jgi:phage repressor protein C with HTH and peptisase S24 domain|uniref:Helix-turn-helix domain-containing protein n=2 Tax=Pseudomonas chaetocerotis TaxID=2758695 RepID=A0A931GJ33_9PSED